MSGPLEGFRVIDLTQLASGPMATCLLADQGADVIKVEPPGRGDLMRHMAAARATISSIFATFNRNKRSIALDLRDPRGVDLLKRIVAGADVLVQNFRPGVVERMGIGEPDLREVNAELVYVSISGFGEKGPYAQRKVFDSVIQVLAGFADAQSDPATGRPELMRNMICDKLSALTVSQAITAALLSRASGGGGQHVRLNMLDASVAFFWADGMAEHTLLKDDGTALAMGTGANMTLRRTSDGYMTISGLPQAEFEGVCRAIAHPELIEDPRFADAAERRRHLREFEALIEEFTSARTTAEVSARLTAEQVPHGHVNTREALPSDPQVQCNELIVELEHPLAGRMRMPRPVTQFGDAPREIRRPPPALGEHGAEILAEVGLPESEIDALRAAAVLG